MSRSARLRQILGQILGLTLAAWLMMLAPAAAYVDPGSTSVVFQAIVAALAAAGLTVRMWWHRVAGLLRPGGRGEAEGVPTGRDPAPAAADDAPVDHTAPAAADDAPVDHTAPAGPTDR